MSSPCHRRHRSPRRHTPDVTVTSQQDTMTSQPAPVTSQHLPDDVKQQLMTSDWQIPVFSTEQQSPTSQTQDEIDGSQVKIN